MSASDDALQQLLGSTSQGLSALPGLSGMGGKVYLPGYGTTYVPPGVSGASGVPHTEADDYMPVNQAKTLPATWDQQTLNKFINNGVVRKIDGFHPDMGLDEVLNKWDDFVNLSQNLNQNGIKMSPFDIINSYRSREGETFKKGNWLYDAVTGEPVKYVGPTSRTSTSDRFDMSTREDALALAKTSMAQMLGRMPTADEVGNYLNLLNGYESANPAHSTTTESISPETGEVTGSSTVSSGGVTQAGRQALLEEQMKKNPEYGAYQASTTYFNAMMQSIMRGY